MRWLHLSDIHYNPTYSTVSIDDYCNHRNATNCVYKRPQKSNRLTSNSAVTFLVTTNLD